MIAVEMATAGSDTIRGGLDDAQEPPSRQPSALADGDVNKLSRGGTRNEYGQAVETPHPVATGGN